PCCAESRQHELSAAKRLVLTFTNLALSQVPVQRLHLLAGYCAIEIGGEHRLGLCAGHDATSTCLAQPRGWVAFAGFRPSSSPTSRTYSLRRFLSASRPRVMRDLTVPNETWVISAICS